jgi:hypothetical protein
MVSSLPLSRWLSCSGLPIGPTQNHPHKPIPQFEVMKVRSTQWILLFTAVQQAKRKTPSFSSLTSVKENRNPAPPNKFVPRLRDSCNSCHARSLVPQSKIKNRKSKIKSHLPYPLLTSSASSLTAFASAAGATTRACRPQLRIHGVISSNPDNSSRSSISPFPNSFIVCD